MGKIVLSANPGSQSRKFALYEDGNLMLSMHFEIDNSSKIVNIVAGDKKSRAKVTNQEYKQPLSFFLIWAISNDIIPDDSVIDSAGLRVVSPGSYFQKHRILDQEFLDKLVSQQAKAPLHITASVREARELMKNLPQTLLIAVSDSAFHATINDSARIYAIDHEDTEKYDIHRFGYHGISYQSVLRKLELLAGKLHDKVVVCHLGGGGSITAIKNGISYDTSMGYSPLEGLPMVTRSGDIGIDAVFELMHSKNLSQAQILTYLNTKSGLKGISGTNGDIRKLLELSSQSHELSKNALDYFAYSVKKHIGSYVAAMNGLDILVFTGTAGYRSPELRDMICAEMEHLGLHIDEHKNNTLEGDGFINKHGHTGIAVIETDEMTEIARITADLTE